MALAQEVGPTDDGSNQRFSQCAQRYQDRLATQTRAGHPSVFLIKFFPTRRVGETCAATAFEVTHLPETQ
eukprot:6476725-Amphidinium_carterae.1